MSVRQALKRPGNYNTLAPDVQWAIDKSLGILDWDPTPDEAKQYQAARAATAAATKKNTLLLDGGA
jgi:hypothetical protein